MWWRRVFLVFVLKLTTEGADGDSDALTVWLCLNTECVLREEALALMLF